MGFVFGHYAKGMYIDGHKSEDVVAYRKEFLETIARYYNFIFFLITNIY